MTQMARQDSALIRAIPVALGLLGLALGFTLGALNGSFTPLHFAILGVSILSCAGGLLWLQNVRWKETLASLVYTVFFLCCVLLVYLISANRQVRLDITRDNLHTLTDQTKAVAQLIPAGQVVNAAVFAPAPEQPIMRRFLEAYSRLTPQFEFSIYDAGRDLDVVQQFGGAVNENAVYLSLEDANGTMIRRAPPEIIAIGDSLREHKFSNAIARLVLDSDQKFHYISGHGEARLDENPDSLTTAIQLINDSTLAVEPLRLSEGRIPEESAGLILAGPQRDILDFEKELLIAYLNDGGKLLLMLDPRPHEGQYLPNIQAVLAEYGLRIPNKFLTDPNALNARGSSYTPQVEFARHPISDGTNGVPFMLFEARPMESLDQLPQGVRLRGVLATNEKTWVEEADELRSIRQLIPPDNPQEIGNHIAAVAAEKPTPDGRYGESMRLVAIGDTDAFTDQVIVRNGDAGLFLIQSMNWLREREALLEVPPKILSTTPIVLNTRILWALLGVFMLIGLGITVGGTAYAMIRRRTK